MCADISTHDLGPATGSNWGSQKIANGQKFSATRGWVTKNTCYLIFDENCLRLYKWQPLSQWIAKAMCLAQLEKQIRTVRDPALK